MVLHKGGGRGLLMCTALFYYPKVERSAVEIQIQQDMLTVSASNKVLTIFYFFNPFNFH